MAISSTEYKGVKWSTRNQQFCASITHKGTLIPCGTAETARAAAKLRDLTIVRLGISKTKLQVLKPTDVQQRK